MIKAIFAFFCLLLLTYSKQAFYQKVVVDDKDALCLDGTPGVYYISEGKSKTKFMIYFEAGGWCGDKDLDTTIENCYIRSLGSLGSSKSYPANYTVKNGILSLNQNNNFKDFTKIYFKYCDGSGHQGTKSEPVLYKDAKIYFRGSNLTISKFDHLEQTIGLFSRATEILVTGLSAGGLAAMMWTDFIRQRSVSKNVYCAPDSGIFLDSPNFESKQHQYRDTIINLLKLSNAQISTPHERCAKVFQNQPYMCMFAENLHWYIKTPLFPIQSLYDSWSLNYILGIHCIKDTSLKACNQNQLAHIHFYYKKTLKVLRNMVKGRQNGCWALACVNHGYIEINRYNNPNYQIPMNSNVTIDYALFAWYQRKSGNHRHIDEATWPDNMPCSGL